MSSTSPSDIEIQEALAAAVRAYAGRVLEGGDLPPFPEGDDVDQTAVAVTAAAILKAAEVYSFELAAMFNV